MNPNIHTFRVRENTQYSSDVFTLTIEPVDIPHFSYTAGQYLIVFFPESSNKAGKAYSISSAPHEEKISLTIKNIGEFSGKLCTLQAGATFTATLPYGYFEPLSDTSSLALIAGGIGITPLRSIIFDALHKNPKRHITLLQSVKVHNDMIYKNEFATLLGTHQNFKQRSFVTREETNDPDTHTRRIDPQIDIVHDPSSDTEYMICGSIDFTRSMWRGIKSIGVPEDLISTEAFFSH